MITAICKHCAKAFHRKPCHAGRPFCGRACHREHVRAMKGQPVVIGNEALLPLTKGKVAIVDASDLDALRKFSWYAFKNRPKHPDSNYYAASKVAGLMHRFLLRAGEHECVDHINHNTLDNRRSNLRACTYSENLAWRFKVGGTSRFKGVYWNKRGYWHAQISGGGRMANVYLGSFKSEREAALAYDAAAAERFGAFATLNFPTERGDKGFGSTGR